MKWTKFKPSTEEVRTASKCAAEWAERINSQSDYSRKEFARWLSTSPLHVREFLIAMAWDGLLADLDRDRKIDIKELLERALAEGHSVGIHDNSPTSETGTAEIERPPMQRLEALARCFGMALYETFLESAIAEARVEHYKAIKAGKTTAARWIVVRCYWTLLKPFRTALWASLMAWLKWRSS